MIKRTRRFLPDEEIPEYAGVTSFVWSETALEMIVNYKNDLYRFDIENDTIERLTKTKEHEVNFSFTKEGDGYIFWCGFTLIRFRFGNSYIEEISPNTPSDQQIERKILSSDQQWLAIVTSKSKDGNVNTRKVGYVTYRDRFAKFKQHDRPLAEDPKPAENERWVYMQKVSDPIHNGTEETAIELFHHPGGDEKLRITDPKWSKDNKKLVFRTYNPQTEEIIIYAADVDSTDPAKIVHHARNSAAQRSPERVDPEFTPDGRYVLAVFEDTGFRQPWLIDPITEGKIPILKGNFNADPISFNEEGTTLYVLANKEHLVRRDLYAVDVVSGEMTRMTKETASIPTQ